jgi:uncharacterized membrane protein YccC
VVPLIVDHAFGTGGGTWMSLAGLNGALIDRGGPYRTRAFVLMAAALVSATAVFIGTASAGHPLLAIPVTFAVATLCGLMRMWPDVGQSFGVTTLVTFSLAIAIPAPTIGAAAMRAVYIAIGGSWAMLIAIVVWPLRPYRPVRLSVAACYRAIADYIDDTVASARSREARDPWAFKTHLVIVREAIENARKTLATTRRGRSGEARRGERLLMLHELADQLYAHVIAIAEILDGARAASIPADAREAIRAAGARASAALRAIAIGIESERDLPRVTVDWSGDAIGSPDDGDANRRQLAALFDRLAEYADLAAAFTSTLMSGDPVPGVDDRLEIAELPRRDAALLSLSVLSRPDSVVLQHALRVGLATTLAVVVTSLFRLNHGYWVTLTMVVILQPYGAATRQRAVQRVAGTVVGAAMAAVLSALFAGSSMTIVVLIFTFTVLCVALLPVNYGAYAIFGTPAFVLLAESSAGNWHLAGLRVVNTLIGGVLALIAARVLWPVDEWTQLSSFLAQAVRANAELLRRAVPVAQQGGSRAFGALRDARRSIALAATNAEDSFQRLIGEYEGPSEALEPVMACLVYTRRFAAATAGLALAGGIDPAAGDRDVESFATAAASVLDDLADAIAVGRSPSALPELATGTPSGASASPIHARMRRIARQLKGLHDAVERWMLYGPVSAKRTVVDPTPIAAR